jgi:hypothetical protein
VNDRRLYRFAGALALLALIILPISAMIIILNPAGQDERYLEILSGAIISCGAPILGMVILRQQPRNRIGWLWLIYGLSIAFFSLSYALKFQANSSDPGRYSDPLFAMLLFSETASIIRLISLVLLILWFPDGRPPSPRWRFIHWWAAISLILISLQLFSEQVPWDDIQGIVGGAPTVENPVGFLPEILNPTLSLLMMIGFFSILAMSFLAILSIISRYRSAGGMVRAQILWFVMGSISYAIVWVAFLILLDRDPNVELAGVLQILAILPFYLAVGIAITRYRLYDINVIIRRTLVYGLLTAALALVFFGGVTLLQSLFQAISGQQSPISIVLSTLVIAALFNPLRLRIQNSTDRRFYRKKYDAEQTLAGFAEKARDETDIEKLSTELIAVVSAAFEPESVGLWLKK